MNDKLIYFSEETNPLAIIEHEGKWYSPSEFRKVEHTEMPIIFIQKEDNEFVSKSLPIQTSDFEIFFAYCQEKDLLLIM